MAAIVPHKDLARGIAVQERIQSISKGHACLTFPVTVLGFVQLPR